MTRTTKKTPIKTKERKRRTPEQMIRDLEAEIARIKTRAEMKKAKRDPALRHVTAAVRSIDKAIDATTDAATKKALDEARATLSAVLALGGAAVQAKGRSPVLVQYREEPVKTESQVVTCHVEPVETKPRAVRIQYSEPQGSWRSIPMPS